MEFQLLILLKEKYSCGTKKQSQITIRKQIKSTEILDLAYLRHDSLIGYKNRENYVKNACRYWEQKTIANDKIYTATRYVIFQSKINEIN
jgi:hypothetical protein